MGQLRLMDGEIQASKILQFSQVKFNGNVAIEIPCLVPETRDRDILVLTSSDCISWKQISHERNIENEKQSSKRVLLNYLPKYMSLYTRYRMTSLNVGPGGGILSTHDERARVKFPSGALKKLTNVMVQTFPVPSKFCKAGIHTGPILSLEPRRRRFHQNVHYYLPGPTGISCKEERENYHCRVLCSITEGTNETDWKDVTENVDVPWINDPAPFVPTLSGRFWILFYEKRLFKLSDTEKLLSHAKRIYESTITPSYYIEIFSRLVQVNIKEIFIYLYLQWYQ